MLLSRPASAPAFSMQPETVLADVTHPLSLGWETYVSRVSVERRPNVAALSSPHKAGESGQGIQVTRRTWIEGQPG